MHRSKGCSHSTTRQAASAVAAAAAAVLAHSLLALSADLVAVATLVHPDYPGWWQPNLD